MSKVGGSQVGVTHQIAVYLGGTVAALSQAPDDEALAPAHIAAGFVGCEDYVAEAFGVERNARGNVADQSFRTNVDKVYLGGTVAALSQAPDDEVAQIIWGGGEKRFLDRPAPDELARIYEMKENVNA